MANTTENPNEETIKCVVVGDNNVGKTRLICARAYNEQCPKSRIFNYTSHVPTVWAIDQYRISKEVLQNARCVIDGITVSLRLWDTFGDHHKNRKFAYGKADVVVICFSICDEKSLRQVSRFWYPEVRKHCKNIPVILVGCKADLRFADLVKLNKMKGSLSRVIRHTDILYPDICRAASVELNCPYYESSVLLAYGVHDIFENVCRAALIYRRTLSFWNSRLKKITRPSLQKPLEPPKPNPPIKNDTNTLLLPKLIELYEDELLTDVVFLCQERKIAAHKAILGAASEVLFELFANEEACVQTSDNICAITSNSCCPYCSLKVQNNSVILTLKELKIFDDCQDTKEDFNSEEEICSTTCTCQKASNLFIQFCGKNNQGKSLYTLNYPFKIAHTLIDFCYTGTVDGCDNRTKLSPDFAAILSDAAQRIGLSHLDLIMNATLKGDFDYAADLTKVFLLHRSQNIKKLCIDREYFADVIFEVDDGSVHGHKILLSGGCDVMKAMFAGRFMESENKQVPLPQTTANCLQTVFKYIYLNEMEFEEEGEDLCDLITVANRLCLDDLVSRLENEVMERFERREMTYNKTLEVALIKNMCEEAILLLRTAQVHNAPVLLQWCLYFLCARYNEACRHASKFMKILPPDIQRYLEEHRWPPVWYIKQRDHYDRALLQRSESEHKKVKRY